MGQADVWGETVAIRVADVTVQLPAVLRRRDEAPIDSASAVYEGAGVRVVIDVGPFAATLRSPSGSGGHEERNVHVGGVPARVVTFDEADGNRTVAVHVPHPPCTVAATGGPDVPHEVLETIISTLEIAD